LCIGKANVIGVLLEVILIDACLEGLISLVFEFFLLFGNGLVDFIGELFFGFFMDDVFFVEVVEESLSFFSLLS
jgi:hypothetical protein